MIDVSGFESMQINHPVAFGVRVNPVNRHVSGAPITAMAGYGAGPALLAVPS
jgi:hypothetical protein